MKGHKVSDLKLCIVSIEQKTSNFQNHKNWKCILGLKSSAKLYFLLNSCRFDLLDWLRKWQKYLQCMWIQK